MAMALGLSVEDIEVTGVSAADASARRRTQSSAVSARIDFTISGEEAATALEDLSAQLSDPASELRTSATLSKVNDAVPLSFAFVCPQGRYRMAGDAECRECGGDKIVNAEQTGCEPCPAGTVPSKPIQTECVCEVGSYHNSTLPKIECFDLNWFRVPSGQLSDTGCLTCPSSPSCLNCSKDGITLQEGYQLLDTDAPLSQTRSAIKCPIKSACPSQVLELEPAGPESDIPRLVAQNCSAGHTGALCGSCVVGWKKGPLGTCEECSPTKTGAVNPLFLIPFAIVVAYVVIRRASALHRESRLQELGRARRMFNDMDTDKSGTITTEEMQRNLSVLGLDIDKNTSTLLVESIDRDRSGDIDVHEFTAWMGEYIQAVQL